MLALMFALIGEGHNACAKKVSALAVNEARERMVSSSDLIIPVTEMPRGKGRRECVRFVFNIDSSGAPYNIRVAEDSNNFIINLAAYRALVKYKFKPCDKSKKQFTLIFSGLVGGVPEGVPFPSEKKE